MENKYITPGMKLSNLFNYYPELESIINQLIPSLNKINNAILKKSIYNTTTIDIAAKTANIEISDIINILREKVGQNTMINSNGTAPEWANESNVNYTLNAKPLIEAGEHPLTEFMNLVDGMKPDEIILLITPFLPSPLIDKAINRGLINWTDKRTETDFYNYFKK